MILTEHLRIFKNVSVIYIYIIFFFHLFLGQIWGNLISSEIFSQRPENESLYLDLSESELKSCGANFDPTIEENKTTLKKPELEKVTKKCTFMRITSPYLKINLSWLKKGNIHTINRLWCI